MVGGPCDFRVSPRSKSFFFSFLGGLLFDLGASWDKGLDSDLDQGLTIHFNSLKVFYLLNYFSDQGSREVKVFRLLSMQCLEMEPVSAISSVYSQ